MLEELKTLLRDALKAVRQRIEPIEDEVKVIKSDLADLKAFRDELKGAGFGDLKADLDALGGKGDATKPSDPAPQPEPETPAPDAPAPAPVAI